MFEHRNILYHDEKILVKYILLIYVNIIEKSEKTNC